MAERQRHQPQKEMQSMRVDDTEVELLRREVSCAALLEC